MSSSVLIVRPFGNHRPVMKKSSTGELSITYFDFDNVENRLILPAMAATNLQGGTTKKIFEPGDIREDMFTDLLLADIVIADITIHNANVFYELGIRHALRDKITILIKSPGYDETPFDIIGYRYVSYKQDSPGEALDILIQTIREACLARNRKDSPVFAILPYLETQDTEKYIALPEDFVDEVEAARAAGHIGKLALLGFEAENFRWQIPALRRVGEALFHLKQYSLAKEVWQKITDRNRDDVQANDRLSTINQRLAEIEVARNPVMAKALLELSDRSAGVIMKARQVTKQQKAEAATLLARNDKMRWQQSWEHLSGAARAEAALTSEYLYSALKSYEQAFLLDLNHFYSGLNTFALISVIIALAEKYPQIWELRFFDAEEAEKEIHSLKAKKDTLSATLKYSIDAAKQQHAGEKPDIWLLITEADYWLLASTRPLQVAARYKAVLERADDSIKESVTKQLMLYRRLEIFTSPTEAVLASLHIREKNDHSLPGHFLLFAGHMIDKANRTFSRFPASKAEMVKSAIYAIVQEVKNELKDKAVLTGIAGGASGGDILFHEVCEALNISSKMFLALPADLFKASSVVHAGPDWVRRFDRLYQKLVHPVLSDTASLPRWLQKMQGYSIWERNNLWQLNFAMANGGMNMTLIALWDEKVGDGPGGTADMVKKARDRGAQVRIIEMDKW